MNYASKIRNTLFVCFIVFFMLFSFSAKAELSKEHAELTDNIASAILAAAWQTAKYSSWEYKNTKIWRDEIDLVFRIHARSAWTGGSLWLDVIITLEDGKVKNLRWGDYKAVFPPGSAYRALGAMLSESK